MQPKTGSDSVLNNPGNTHLYFTWNWGTSNNNGNLQSMITSHGGPTYPQFLTFNDYYWYDGVNRVTEGNGKDVNNNLLWARNFAYDRYGNLWTTGSGGVPEYGTTPTSNIFNPATNRMITSPTTRPAIRRRLALSRSPTMPKIVKPWPF